jgi:hypothetical protein
MKPVLLWMGLVLGTLHVGAQGTGPVRRPDEPDENRCHLRAGFEKKEYLRLLQIADHGKDSSDKMPPTLPFPENCRLLYRSAEMGLGNRWDLWLEGDSVGIISIRGTIGRQDSWMENFYAAMVPATGSLRLNDSTTFSYRLAADSQACVHAGWLIGMASLAPSILEKIREYAAKGIHEFIIAGHSQGGAIAFLLRSYLFYLDEGRLDPKLIIKTYCSAAPKPGNLYYAYDFDYITRGGWALRVVNPRDWVPEIPFSVQTLHDVNAANPFTNVHNTFHRAPFLARFYLKMVYWKLDGSTQGAERKYRKYLGHPVYTVVHKSLPQLREPRYVHSTSYCPAGTAIVLPSYPGYAQAFPSKSGQAFTQHALGAYYQLANHL